MDEIIKELYEYIVDNAFNDINLNKLEQEYFYNKFYILRSFKEYTGYTITEFINKIKVYRSVDPLLLTNDTILKIALNNGFNSQEYYSEKFKNVIGLSPKKFRKEYSNISNNNLEELKEKRRYLEQIKNEEQKIYSFNKEKEKVYKKGFFVK